MSKLETNTIDNISGSSTLTIGDSNASTISIPKNITLGASGTTITVPSGATITNNGTQTGFGGTNTPAFSAYISSNQSIPTLSFTKIQFNTEQFDTDGTYDNSTNYRFTPGVAGKYYIFANVYMNTITDGKNFRLDIYKNGVSYMFGRNNSSKSGSSISVNVSFIDNASATDYYEIFVYQDEGSNLNAASGRRTSFGASKIIE
jgi:hypothetical protein